MATLTPDWIGRQGDREKDFDFTCTDTNGPVAINDAISVTVHISKGPGKDLLVSGACLNLDTDGTGPNKGKGKYQWGVGETDDLVGLYYAEIEVIGADGKPQSFPDGDNAYSYLFFSRQLG